MRMNTANCLTAAILALALAAPVMAWAGGETAPAKTATGAATATPDTRRETVEQRIADMYAALKITPEQSAPWDAFAQVMLDNAQAMDSALTKADGSAAPRTAEQMMQSYAGLAQIHAANVQRLSTAFATLYGTLSPVQKLAADDMFRTSAAEREAKKHG